jgi:hypothetical protein
LLGPTWEGAASIILPISLWMVGLAVSVPATAGVRALLAVKKSLAARLVVALFGVMATLVGAGLEGAVGAAWGMACASLVGATVWWLQLHRAIVERESAPPA